MSSTKIKIYSTFRPEIAWLLCQHLRKRINSVVWSYKNFEKYSQLIYKFRLFWSSQSSSHRENFKKYSKLINNLSLYIPAFWWHQVSALSHGVSVNIFWGEGGECSFMSKVIDTQPFHYWMTNVIEQNRSFDSFERSLGKGITKLWNEFLKQAFGKLLISF